MRSKTTRAFWKLHDALPADVRQRAGRSYTLWRAYPHHPSLRFKSVSDRHAVFSIRIGLNWRALGYMGEEADTIVWFWIGSHADYDRLTDTL